MFFDPARAALALQSVQTVRVPRLTPHGDWHEWVLAVEEAATLGGWADVLYGRRPRPESTPWAPPSATLLKEQAKWDEENQRAYLLLRSLCDYTVKMTMGDETCAARVYVGLRKRYGSSSVHR